MKVRDVLTQSDILWTNQETADLDYQGCYVSDLLSNVLKQAKEGNGLITTLSNLNVIAVASLLNLSFVLFCEGKEPSQEMIEKANEEEIALISTQQKAIDIILLMHHQGML